MEKGKCPKGYMLYVDPVTGKEKCITPSEFYKDWEKEKGRPGMIKMINRKPPKGRTTLAKKGGSVKSKKKK
jgi:hypothetical protein